MRRKEFTWEVNTTHSLSPRQIKDLLTTAIEGGINYWAVLGNDDPAWVAARDEYIKEHNGDKPCYCDVAYAVLEQGKSIVLYDKEDNNQMYTLSWEDLITGCKEFEKQDFCSLPDLMYNCSFDAGDADIIIQLSIFGEVIYG